MCVVAFGWLVVSRCVLTMDNQWKRRMIVVNGALCVEGTLSQWAIFCFPINLSFACKKAKDGPLTKHLHVTKGTH